jgi:hypothetical protein
MTTLNKRYTALAYIRPPHDVCTQYTSASVTLQNWLVLLNYCALQRLHIVSSERNVHAKHHW